MKACTTELLALLATNQFFSAELWNIRLNSGTVLRYTTADIDITANGNPYASRSDLLARGRLSQQLGLEVDSLDVDIYPKSEDLIGGVPFLTAIRLGYFDAAEVEILQAFMPAMGDVSVGTIVRFSGRMGQISQCGQSKISCTVNSWKEILNVKTPRAVYQASCPWNFGDANCRADKTAYMVSAAVGSGATATRIPVTTSQTEGWGAQGILAFASGACSGLTRMVTRYAGDVCTVYPPLPAIPAAGDSVTLTPGCDKSWSGSIEGSEKTVVPSASPYTVIIPAATGDWGVVGHVTKSSTDSYGHTTTTVEDIAFVKVAGSPASHEYSFSAGTYTFAAADAGTSLTITCYAVDAVGCGRFLNNKNFGGCPYIPVATTTT